MSEPRDRSVHGRLKRQAEQLENLASESATRSSFSLNNAEEQELRELVQFLRGNLDQLRLANVQARLKDVEEILRNLKQDLAQRRDQGRPTRVIEAMVWEAENERGRVMASLSHVTQTPSRYLAFHQSGELRRPPAPPDLTPYFQDLDLRYSVQAEAALHRGLSWEETSPTDFASLLHPPFDPLDLRRAQPPGPRPESFLTGRSPSYSYPGLTPENDPLDLRGRLDASHFHPSPEIDFASIEDSISEQFQVLNRGRELEEMWTREASGSWEEVAEDEELEDLDEDELDQLELDDESYEDEELEDLDEDELDQLELEDLDEDELDQLELDDESYEDEEPEDLDEDELDQLELDDESYEDEELEDLDEDELDQLELDDEESLEDEELELEVDEEDLALEDGELDLEVDEEDLALEDDELELEVDEEDLALEDDELELDDEELLEDDELELEDDEEDLAELELDDEELLDDDELELEDDEEDLAELELDDEESLEDDELELEVDEEDLALEDDELELDDEESLEDEELELEVDEEDLALEDDELELDDEELLEDDELELEVDEEDLALEDDELELDDEELLEDEELELGVDEEDLAELELDDEESLEDEELELEVDEEDLAELELDDEESLEDEELELEVDEEELEVDEEDLALEDDELELDDEEPLEDEEDLTELEFEDEELLEDDELELEVDEEDLALEDDELELDEELQISEDELSDEDLADLELDDDEELDLDDIDLEISDEELADLEIDEDEELDLEETEGPATENEDIASAALEENELSAEAEASAEILLEGVASLDNPEELMGAPTELGAPEFLGAPAIESDTDSLFSGPAAETLSDDFFSGAAPAEEAIEKVAEEEEDELLDDLDSHLDEVEEERLAPPSKEYRSSILEALRQVQTKGDAAATRADVLSVLETAVPKEYRAAVSERRRLVRLSCEYEVNCFQGNQIFHATIKDISLGGMKIEVARQLEAGSELQVSNPNRTENDPDERITAQVRWFRVKDDGLAEVGLQFVDPPEVLGRSWVVSLLNRVGMQSQVFNQRKYTRAAADFDINVLDEAGDVYPGRCVDLGLGGALIDTEPHFEQGDLVTFLCPSFGIHGRLEAEARVVTVKHLEDSYGRYAVEFENLDAATTKLLGRYVVDLLKLGRGHRHG